MCENEKNFGSRTLLQLNKWRNFVTGLWIEDFIFIHCNFGFNPCRIRMRIEFSSPLNYEDRKLDLNEKKTDFEIESFEYEEQQIFSKFFVFGKYIRLRTLNRFNPRSQSKKWLFRFENPVWSLVLGSILKCSSSNFYFLFYFQRWPCRSSGHL